MNDWHTWPHDRWSSMTDCPYCGRPLIIAEKITQLDTQEVFAGICPDCKKQFTITAHIGELTVDHHALRQEERIQALEAKIARLESMIAKLTTAPMTRQLPQEAPEADDFQKKYGFLLG